MRLSKADKDCRKLTKAKHGPNTRMPYPLIQAEPSCFVQIFFINIFCLSSNLLNGKDTEHRRNFLMLKRVGWKFYKFVYEIDML